MTLTIENNKGVLERFLRQKWILTKQYYVISDVFYEECAKGLCI